MNHMRRTLSTTRSRGFTLIELLVVIAIIGILSAVVLASLSSARSKANDAAIQADLSSVRTQAEIYYQSNGSAYATVSGNTCSVANTLFADPTIVRAISGATTAAGGSSNVVCGNSTSAYAVSAKLTAPSSATYWCVDSTGFAGTRTTVLVAGATVCPAS